MNIYCIFLDCEPVLLTRVSLEAVLWAPVSLMLPAIIIYVTAAVILSWRSTFVTCISYPSSRTSHFSQELQFLSLTNALEMRIWDRGVCVIIGLSLF